MTTTTITTPVPIPACAAVERPGAGGSVTTVLLALVVAGVVFAPAGVDGVDDGIGDFEPAGVIVVELKVNVFIGTTENFESFGS